MATRCGTPCWYAFAVITLHSSAYLLILLSHYLRDLTEVDYYQLICESYY